MRIYAALLLMLLVSQFALGQETTASFPQGTVAADVDTDGYIPDPEAADAFAKRIPKFINDQVDILADDSDDESAFIYRYLAKARGEATLTTRNQKNEGSCVGYGTASAVDTLAAVEIFAFGESELFVPTNADALYGLSRRNNLGAWQGSTGSWSAEAISKVGTLHQIQYPTIDLRLEDPANARRFRSRGVPKDLYKFAEKRKVINVARVETVKQLRGLLQSGYPVFICSTVGFNNGRNGYMTWRSDGDVKGFATPRGSWAHCMTCYGYRGESSGRRGFLIGNSWRSEGHNVGPGRSYVGGGVYPEDQPFGSFWVDAQVMQRILNAKDSWSVAGYQGFPKRKITLKDAFTYPGGREKGLPESTPNYQLAP